MTNLAWAGAAIVVAIAASRVRVARRQRQLVATGSPRTFGPTGVLAGADSISLDASTGRAILILHGFNDTPQSVSALAHALHAQGWTVRAPLLPQHGRAFAEMANAGSAQAWTDMARAEWRALLSRFPRAALAGQSMGGAIASTLAVEAPPSALVLLAPYLAMGWLPRLLTRVWPLWALVTPRLFADPRRGLRDAEARARSLGPGVFTPRLVRELRRVVDAAGRALPKIAVPTLVLHSRGDYRIPSASASQAFQRIGSARKELLWRDDTGHILAADRGRDEVAALVAAWLDRQVTTPGT